MAIYTRYFKITDGPLMDTYLDAIKINNNAHDEYKVILKDLGASNKYWIVDDKLSGIEFDGDVDRSLYKRVNKGWMPKKNTKKAKAINKKLTNVRTKSISSCLNTIGLHDHPALTSHNRWYKTTILAIPEKPPVIYITVPWKDVDPNELKEYQNKRSKGICMNRNMDHLLWIPHESMVEVKCWEFEKHLDEWNEYVRKSKEESK